MGSVDGIDGLTPHPLAAWIKTRLVHHARLELAQLVPGIVFSQRFVLPLQSSPFADQLIAAFFDQTRFDGRAVQQEVA